MIHAHPYVKHGRMRQIYIKCKSYFFTKSYFIFYALKMEEETTNRPKWLLELENRKQKPRLAHEAGAGAPCTNCNSACPGLDLHFWRKICKNCKCGRDDHDVDDDEFPQFDLLFGPSLGKFKKKSMRLQVSNKRQNDGESTFEWVPPDTPKELAVDYMKALPVEKLPIKGSIGAVLRRQLLQKQLPLHDVDHKVCDELSEQEQKQFEKYLENIKRYVGQGKVIKMFGARPFERSLMTPVNATDMQECSPQHTFRTSSANVQLRTPSSFDGKNLWLNDTILKRRVNTVTSNDELSTTKEYNRTCTLDNLPAGSNLVTRSQPIEEELKCNNLQHANEKGINSKAVNSSIVQHLAEQEIVSTCKGRALGNYTSPFEEHERRSNDRARCTTIHRDAVNEKTALIAESMLADALLPPSAIHANDIIGSTLDEKELKIIREKLADKYNTAGNPVTMRTVSRSVRPLDTSGLHSCNGEAKENDLAGVGKCPAEIVRAPETLVPLEAKKQMYKPLSQVVESTVVAGSTERINEQQQRTHTLQSNGRTAANSNVDQLITKSVTDPLGGRNSADSTLSNLSKQTSASKQKPVDAKSDLLQVKLDSSPLRSFVVHSEQSRNQVFPHLVVGDPQSATIPASLSDTVDKLKLDSINMQKCERCRERIRVGDVAVIVEKANNAAWHPGCFACSICNELLVDLVYFYYKNRLYCGRDLAAFLEIPRCFACDELIFVREYTVAEGHNYHVKHFCCWDCDTPLAGQQYITENDRPLCLPCYKKSYAKTCIACNVVIAADQQGVAVKNLNFHATEMCFCCYSCKRNLLNSKMAIRKDKLFCSKECIAKFINSY